MITLAASSENQASQIVSIWLFANYEMNNIYLCGGQGMRWPQSLIAGFVIAFTVCTGAVATDDKDQWSLTDKQWRSADDLELIRSSQLSSRCHAVKSINATSDPRSIQILAIAYRHGICVESDVAQSRKWMDAAAAANEPRAMLAKAAYIAETAASESDFSTAFELIRRASEQGDFRAKAALALAYLQGVGTLVPKDIGRSQTLMAEAARGGYWPILLMYQEENVSPANAENRMSSAEITSAWRAAAESGNQFALSQYVDRLEKGLGVTIDAAGVAAWKRKLAEAPEGKLTTDGLAATENVFFDWVLKESEIQRVKRLTAAADQGDVEAIYQLAQALEYGSEQVPADLDRAVALYRRAARSGHALATLGAVQYLLDPLTPQYNEDEGIALLRQQIRPDNPNAGEYRRKLASHFATTGSIKRSIATAQALLREGVAAGDPYAARDLAMLTAPKAEDDEATQKLRNAAEAARMFERYLASSEGSGDFDTMAVLAELYRTNYVRLDGIDDEAKANFWIFKSANGGSALGNVYLGDYYFYGDAQQTVDFAKAKKHWLTAKELNADWDLADRIAMVDSALSEDRATVTAAQMVALGKRYESGDQRPVNWTKAIYWLQRGVDAGNTDRGAIATLAGLYDIEGQYSRSEPLWRRLTTGNDEIAQEARARIAEFDADRAAARQAAANAAASRAAAVPAAVPAKPKTAAAKPAVVAIKPSGNAKVPIGKALICETKIWSGFKSVGILSRDREPRYDDAFRLEFTSRNQIRITGSDKMKNGVRSIAVQGNRAIINEAYPSKKGMLGVTHWNVSPFNFNLDEYTFEERWENSMGGQTIYRGNCE